MKRLIVAVLLAAAASPALADKRIQCWTDKDGRRMCGDAVPQEYASGKRDVIKDGRVVETIKGVKTPEEIAEEQRLKKEAEDRQKQAAYDRALLETYRSSKDIIAMRDERLALIDSRIASNEKNAADTDKGLVDLKARAAELESEGKKVPDKLAKQIRQFEKAQKQNRQALERARAERLSVQQRFDYDLARYEEMHLTPEEAAAQNRKKPAAATPAPGKTGG